MVAGVLDETRKEMADYSSPFPKSFNFQKPEDWAKWNQNWMKLIRPDRSAPFYTVWERRHRRSWLQLLLRKKTKGANNNNNKNRHTIQ